MKFFFFGLFLSLISFHANSESTVSNGADLVECEFSSGEKRAYLLDYFDTETGREIEIDLGPSELNIEGKLQLANERLKRYSKVVVEGREVTREIAGTTTAPVNMSARVNFSKIRFDQKRNWYEGGDLPDVQDSGPVTLPSNCVLKQLAMQFNLADPIFLVQKELWDSLDNNHKAGLILHEVIYAQSIREGHQTSVASRKLNALIATDSIRSMTREQYFDFLSTYFPNSDYANYGESTVALDKDNAYEFLPDGMTPRVLKIDGYIGGARWGFVNAESVTFHPNGNAKRIEFVNSSGDGIFNVGGQTQSRVTDPSMIEFHSNGQVKTYTKDPKELGALGALIISPEGDWNCFSFASSIELDRDRNVIQGREVPFSNCLVYKDTRPTSQEYVEVRVRNTVLYAFPDALWFYESGALQQLNRWDWIGASSSALFQKPNGSYQCSDISGIRGPTVFDREGYVTSWYLALSLSECLFFD